MLSLPQSPRRIYRDTYLSRVVVQFRFPPVLRIAEGLSPKVHDRLRHDYPGYRNEVAGALQLRLGDAVVDGPATLPRHILTSEDGAWEAIIEAGGVTLTTTKYTRWEDASSRFDAIATAVWEHYAPSYVSRVGLRYQDAIEKPEASPAVWTSYVRDELVAFSTCNELVDGMRASRHLLDLEHEAGRIRFQWALQTGSATDGSPVQRLDLDFDMFADDLRESASEGTARLAAYHDVLIQLFEWVIKKKLRDEMSPEE